MRRPAMTRVAGTTLGHALQQHFPVQVASSQTGGSQWRRFGNGSILKYSKAWEPSHIRLPGWGISALLATRWHT